VSAAEDYLKELLGRRERYKDPDALKSLAVDFRDGERRPPREFKDSSFLYMRSYHGDMGVRPFSNIAFWRSPDIEISPVTNIGAPTTQLEAGETYLVRCTLRNGGDVAVPSAKVELFLTDPSLGFDTRYAENLTLGKVPATWVAPDGSASTVFRWTIAPAEAGHKCLFARTFSFSPLDLPVSDYALDPRTDRHVAQQNVDIVGQAQSYSFKLIHQPVARMRIDLRPLQPEELLRLRHPLVAGLAPAAEVPQGDWGELAQIGLEDRGEGNVSVEVTREGARVIADGQEGDGDKHSRPHRSSLRMTVPDLGLQPGQAAGLDITAVDERDDKLGPVGGITLVIVGSP
jgi:hypothetical protein